MNLFAYSAGGEQYIEVTMTNVTTVTKFHDNGHRQQLRSTLSLSLSQAQAQPQVQPAAASWGCQHPINQPVSHQSINLTPSHQVTLTHSLTHLKLLTQSLTHSLTNSSLNN